jgi:DNA helicase II / ATP-dependent DNA helicase PcrA
MDKKVSSIDFFWDRKGFTPTPEQKDAILHQDGPLFLTAGPGSGKTRVLLWRTLNLLVYQDVKPEEIFLSTFTEKAAHQLRDGLRSLLALVTNTTGQPFDISKMSIGTVHSICQNLLVDRRLSPDGMRTHAPNVFDALSQYFQLYNRFYWKQMIEVGGFKEEIEAQKTINNFLAGSDSGSRHWAVQNCMGFFNRLSEENLKPERLKTSEPILKALLKMYSFYLKSLKEGNDTSIQTVDLSLLQQSAYEAIVACPTSHSIFKHVIIDEYQDTNTIQELIFFSLAKGSNNICVVGDDDQALYRFRGATVENLVQFPARCEQHLAARPKRIDLVTNFRSKKSIVDFYTSFIGQTDWTRKGKQGEYYRIADKKISANSQDKLKSVVVSTKGAPANVYSEIALFVKSLKEEGKIEDYKQVAFLFPSVKSQGEVATRVKGFMEAFDNLGIPYYAPRAGRFIEVLEAMEVYGLFLLVFGRPSYGAGASFGLQQFRNWMERCKSLAKKLCEDDEQLTEFIKDKKGEIDQVLRDYEILTKVASKKKWDLKAPFELKMTSELANASGLSDKAKKALTGRFFLEIVKRRIEAGKPFTLEYIFSRATSLDWSVLDLFYQVNGFKHFRHKYELAENGTDEGPVCNLGLITQYLSRFMEEYPPVITAKFLTNDKFTHCFFTSYTYALYRLQESEYEDAEDPFPKGRVPFLTIHQSKGLEFPVVVLGSLYKQDRSASRVEQLARQLTGKEGEPLDRVGEFDNMRMFYVALSRAKNLLVMPRFSGQGQRTSESFKKMFESFSATEIREYDLKKLPNEELKEEDLGKSYSYTADFLGYEKCPRSYMIFRKYGFVPSRSQTMFFGSLVHQTIEDLHHLLLNEKKKQTADAVAGS